MNSRKKMTTFQVRLRKHLANYNKRVRRANAFVRSLPTSDRENHILNNTLSIAEVERMMKTKEGKKYIKEQFSKRSADLRLKTVKELAIPRLKEAKKVLRDFSKKVGFTVNLSSEQLNEWASSAKNFAQFKRNFTYHKGDEKKRRDGLFGFENRILKARIRRAKRNHASDTEGKIGLMNEQVKKIKVYNPSHGVGNGLYVKNYIKAFIQVFGRGKKQNLALSKISNFTDDQLVRFINIDPSNLQINMLYAEEGESFSPVLDLILELLGFATEAEEITKSLLSNDDYFSLQDFEE